MNITPKSENILNRLSARQKEYISNEENLDNTGAWLAASPQRPLCQLALWTWRQKPHLTKQ